MHDTRSGGVMPTSGRRNFASTIASAMALVASLQVHAQAPQQLQFPGKAVRIVVPFSAGSQTDVVARVLSPKLSDLWRQPVVIENRAGASGILGAGIVAKGAPDGHTLLLTSASFVIGAAMHAALPYD